MPETWHDNRDAWETMSKHNNNNKKIHTHTHIYDVKQHSNNIFLSQIDLFFFLFCKRLKSIFSFFFFSAAFYCWWVICCAPVHLFWNISCPSPSLIASLLSSCSTPPRSNSSLVEPPALARLGSAGRHHHQSSFLSCQRRNFKKKKKKSKVVQTLCFAFCNRAHFWKGDQVKKGPGCDKKLLSHWRLEQLIQAI